METIAMTSMERAQASSLRGKTALVTGGARGLGREIARALCEAGAHVVIGDIRGDLATRTAEELSAPGHTIRWSALDVRDDDSVQAIIEREARETGLDILINNAAVDHTRSIEELSVADWDQVLETNLRGAFLMAKHAFGHMRRRGGGQIVNIASTAAKRAWPNAAAYHASKWGLLGFSHALHTEGRAHNIKVTAVIAGGMRTPFLLDRFPDLDPGLLQDAATVAQTVRFLLELPAESVIPEITVLPMRETSWP